MADDAAEFLDYEITDAESYAAVLRSANVEISRLAPGRLRGHHLRVGLPGGEISWAETNLPLRGRGRFPLGMRNLAVVIGATDRTMQHGVPVRTGTLVGHGPGAEHDGIYGRDFSVVCLGLRQELLEDLVSREFPELSDLLEQEWLVYEPSDGKRRDLAVPFEQAAAILRSDERVRRSPAARAAIQEDLLAGFLNALAEAASRSPLPALAHAAALVRRADELLRAAGAHTLSVGDLCAACGVPRRTLSHAFQQMLGMGPATYLRRLRLNHVRRALMGRPAGNGTMNVTDVALDHGFWHLSRFSGQYRELFGESPGETARR